MDPDRLSPLEIFAIALVYAATADKEVNVQERASMVAILSKLVRLDVLTEKQLKELTSGAFQYAQKVSLEGFMTTLRGRLTPAQALCLLANLTDLVLSDGMVRDGEVKVIETFRKALAVDASDYRALREVIMLKSDTGLFTNPNHSWNENTYSLNVVMRGNN